MTGLGEIKLDDLPAGEIAWPSLEKVSIGKLNVGNKDHAVVVLTQQAIGVPGSAAQWIVLLSPEGNLLDRIGCEINNRYGRVETEILEKEDKDGARIVIRFKGKSSLEGKPSYFHSYHTIARQGKEYAFYDQEQRERTPNVWDEKGLCRLGIENGRFKVLFPTLELPDLSKTKSLRIGYLSQGARFHAEVDSPERVADLLSKAIVKKRAVIYGHGAPAEAVPFFRPERFHAYVEFIMPDGKKLQAGFRVPTMLEVEGWGYITFDSPAFHDAVKEIVSKVEGRPIDLVTGKPF